MDKAVSSIAAIGIPGLILIVAVSASGYAGAAALTTALAALGGPLGMIGGVGALLLASVIVKALSEFGMDSIFQAVVAQLIKQGETQEGLLKKIQHYPISRSLKNDLTCQIQKAASANKHKVANEESWIGLE